MRQRRHNRRRNRRDRIVQILPQILFRDRQRGEVREFAGHRNHLAAKPRGEFFHGQFGRLCVYGHPRGSIVTGRRAKLREDAPQESWYRPAKPRATCTPPCSSRNCAAVAGRRIFRLHRPAPAAAGVAPWSTSASLAVVGLLEVVSPYPPDLRRVSQTARRRPRAQARPGNPHRFARISTCASPVDSIARAFRWFIWSRRRSGHGEKAPSRDAPHHRRLLCIFPLKRSSFRRHGVNATYIGHPLAGLVGPPSRGTSFFGNTDWPRNVH